MSDQVGARQPGLRVDRQPALRADQRPSYRPEKPAGLDPDVKQFGILAACAGGVLALAAGTVSLVGHRHHGVPVIEAAQGPVRVKPADPGGMKASGSELNVGPGGTQALGPSAEQPEIAALQQQVRAMKRQVARQAAETAKAEKIAVQANQKVMASPAPMRASATALVPEIPPILRSPVPPGGAVAIEARQQAGMRVQLAAFTDAPAARAEWDNLAKKMPDLLAARHAEISHVQIGGRSIYRLRTGPFQGVAEASGFCASLRARGADCSIAAF